MANSNNKKLLEDDVNGSVSIQSPRPISKHEPSEFQQEIEQFFEKHKSAKLERIENLGGSEHEQYDIDISFEIDEIDVHAQDTRDNSKSVVHQLKEEFYNHLRKQGFNVSTMSVRGLRTSDQKIETTISITLSNVPKSSSHLKWESTKAKRVEKLLSSVLSEAEKKR